VNPYRRSTRARRVGYRADRTHRCRTQLLPASYGRDSALTIERSGSSLLATVTIPTFGLENAEVTNLDVEPFSISFEVPEGQEVIAFTGRIAGRWLVGEAELGSVRYPFLLSSRS
jgi:hypothetical protein